MANYLRGTHQLQYGTSTIEYELVFTERDDLAIHVHPDCSVIVEAPFDSKLDSVQNKVRKRAKWIVKQQRTFDEYSSPEPNRMYVSGETHYYLGKRYRLKVIPSEHERVKFNRGWIFLYVKDTDNWQQKHDLMQKWYKSRAKFIFQERLTASYSRFDGLNVPFPGLQIRPMKSQWGSCIPSGKIILNLKLIKVSKKLIDYVIIHELCHLKELNHSQEFYKLLEQVLPTWNTLRQQLNKLDFT